MRQAFTDIGYRVMEVSGYAAERRQAMRRVRAAIAACDVPAFVYGENATIPNALTEPRHLPPHPLLDLSFFRDCQRAGAPVGIFYRDIYWRFRQFRQGINPILEAGLQATYRGEPLAAGQGPGDDELGDPGADLLEGRDGGGGVEADEAVHAGVISEERYESWLRIREEMLTGSWAD